MHKRNDLKCNECGYIREAPSMQQDDGPLACPACGELDNFTEVEDEPETNAKFIRNRIIELEQMLKEITPNYRAIETAADLAPEALRAIEIRAELYDLKNLIARWENK